MQTLSAASGKTDGIANRNGEPSNPHRIVVVGGGVAGLEIASTLPRIARKSRLAVTLIDREPAHVWKPMLHTIAAGTSDVSQQETQYVALARDRHFFFEPGPMAGIDRVAQQVRLSPLTVNGRVVLGERTIPYDTLILAVGSQAHDFGIPGVREHCLTIDSRSQAMDVNREIQARMCEPGRGKSAQAFADIEHLQARDPGRTPAHRDRGPELWVRCRLEPICATRASAMIAGTPQIIALRDGMPVSVPIRRVWED